MCLKVKHYFQKKNSKYVILNNLYFASNFVFWGVSSRAFYSVLLFNFSSSTNHGGRHFFSTPTIKKLSMALHTKVSHLKEILRKNAFPIKLVDNSIKDFLNKMFLHTPVAMTVEKREQFITLPYLGNLSLAIKIRLQKSINKNLPFRTIKFIFKSTARLSKFFRFKKKVPFHLCSNVVYKISCGRCNATYYDGTC